MWGDYVHICALYEVTSINHVTKSTVHILYKLYSMLSTTLQLYRSHCPHSVLINRCDTEAYIIQNTTYFSTYYIFHCHTCARIKYTYQIARISQTFDMHIWRFMCVACHILTHRYQLCH